MQENRIEFLPSAWQDLGEIAERRWRNAPCSAEQITGNAQAAGWKLEKEDLEKLEAVSR